MSAEVEKKGIVVGGEVADAVVFFRTGVDDRCRVVRKSSKVGAVFLGEKGLYLLAFFGIVEEEGVVGAGC